MAKTCSRCRRSEPAVTVVSLIGGETICTRCLTEHDPSPGSPGGGPKSADVDLDDDATPISEAA